MSKELFKRCGRFLLLVIIFYGILLALKYSVILLSASTLLPGLVKIDCVEPCPVEVFLTVPDAPAAFLIMASILAALTSRVKTRLLPLMVLFIILIFSPFIEYLPFQEQQVDEAQWVNASEWKFGRLFLERDISPESWGVEGDWHTYGMVSQPPLAGYICGVASLSSGNYGIYFNYASGKGLHKLYYCRLFMAFLGGLSCLLFFHILKGIFPAWVGVLGALLLAYNPLVLSSCRRAMSEAPLLLFWLLALYFTLRMHQSLGERRNLRWFAYSLLLGLSAGLAASSKLNGCFCLLPLIPILALELLLLSIFKWDRSLQVKRLSVCVPLSIAVAFVTLVVSYPYLWYSPLGNSMKMIKHKNEVLQQTQEEWKSKEAISIASVPYLTRPPNMAESMNFGQALLTHEEKFKMAFLRTMLYYATVRYFLRMPVDILVAIAGFFFLLISAWRESVKSGETSLRGIAWIWASATYVALAATMPLDWRRWYLTGIPAVTIFFCAGLYEIKNIACNLIGQPFRHVKR